MALSAGTRLGPYEIQAVIGTGGMGEVHRARDTKLHRDVAAIADDSDRAIMKLRLMGERRTSGQRTDGAEEPHS
jgi:hypothetical protein